LRQPNNFNFSTLARAAYIFGIHAVPVRSLNFGDFRASALSNLEHAIRKKAVYRHNAFIAFF
jgi:hypothetical protein